MQETTMVVRDTIYIGGAWIPSAGTGMIDVTDPSTEETIGRIPDGAPADVDRAVAAARAAFPGWAATPVEERARLLGRVAGALQERAEEIGALIAREMGMPIKLSVYIQAGLPTIDIGAMPDILRAFPFEEVIGNSLVVREPVGVVGCITPWNYPLHQVTAKIGPALAAGCTVVLKPARLRRSAPSCSPR